MSLTLRRGLSDEIGSWKIIWRRVRVLRSSSPRSFVRSVPSKSTSPLVGFGSCMMARPVVDLPQPDSRSEEHTSELQSLMRISYAVFCLKKKKTNTYQHNPHPPNPTS